MNPITFYEHEKKVWNDIFTEIELNELEKINRVHKCSIFKLLRKEIVATQYVGFIKIKNKTIQVILKYLKIMIMRTYIFFYICCNILRN